MSEGGLIEAVYAADDGRRYKISVHQETTELEINGLQNESNFQGANQPYSVGAKNTARMIGLSPRRVVVKFIGVIPEGYSGDTLDVPWLRGTRYRNIFVGQQGTYLGVPVVLDAKHGESYR